MDPFATVDELETRWRPLDADERTRAEALMMDAAAFIATQLKRAGVPIDDQDETQARNLASVSCAMVRRIIGTNEKLFGITQFSQTAGSFTESGTSANPNGDMYLTASEKALLGITSIGARQRASFIRPAIHTPDGGLIDGW